MAAEVREEEMAVEARVEGARAAARAAAVVAEVAMWVARMVEREVGEEDFVAVDASDGIVKVALPGGESQEDVFVSATVAVGYVYQQSKILEVSIKSSNSDRER